MYINKIFLLLAVLALTSCEGAAQDRQRGGVKLRDISVFYQFNDYRTKGTDSPIGSSLWGSVENENGLLPLERSIRNGNKKVYRVKASGNCGIMFPLHSWGAFSLEQYQENGYIEFDIRGDSGGERFSIGLRSDTRGVVVTSSISSAAQNIQVTKEWQNVKIPIKKFVDNRVNGFSIKNIMYVEIQVSSASQFYLSEMYIRSPDFEKQYPVIKVNQAGYQLNNNKYALVSCFPGSYNLSANTEFNVVNANGQVKFTGKLQSVSRNADKLSGEIIYKADFSQLNEEGTYYIRISNPQIENSFRFTIGSNVYDKLFTDTMKYFYLQRQGIDLEQKYAGVFARKNLHPNDSKVKKISQRDDPRAPLFDISRGWYDAGDFGKYFPPAASTVTDLLFAYEFFPQVFRDNQLNIPESGNGAPDILDEIKWELDMLLRLEDGATGSFFEVANYDGETIFIIDTDGVTGKGNTKSSAATAWAAGVFAHAYLVYKDVPVYRNYAAQCLETAKRAWNYLEKNPNEHTWVNGAGRGYYYDASDVKKIKFLAAAALYRATGEDRFNKYVLDNYRSFNYQREFNAYQVSSIGDIGTGFIHYAMSVNPAAAVMRFFEDKFRDFESLVLKEYDSSPWPAAISGWTYFWGSNKPIARIPAEFYICNKLLNKSTAKSIALLRDSVHYILGINPLSFSFISGYGENCVINIYSGIYTHDKIDAIPPGYLAGGANQYEAGFMSNFIPKCYVDSDREWTTNEHAIYWNAAMVLNLALVMGTINE
ncbi:MAG: glycoside hydrolase family 9 protein [Treponema sp.]|nr:glycoside hydrolase family 9 protein [Treponema sp.]